MLKYMVEANGEEKEVDMVAKSTTLERLIEGCEASACDGNDTNPSTTTPAPTTTPLLNDEVFDVAKEKPAVNYVGLVNQAMTCYLNSLLQALYMTPEFRNALYNWEFDGQNETRSIPYQLQKLFLNLQTSDKNAVETTELTTSFGWNGSEAWHQHDIQELCRVMFDALEHKFKDTKQANLINDLYEGKMLDYVKCLECGIEKSREDTFLDIPLPVRPFNSEEAYGSVQEALHAFVQPETLEGNNQYFCERCNKKCNAHKGLKFTKFPYLLTLHLKRFDFDYNTMHRIKLNDKVVFPELLNLNSFVPATETPQNFVDERESVKCDDCSTTDSGSALDDETCQSTDLTPNVVNGHEDTCDEIDEGIDMTNGNAHGDKEAKGPYLYELFSIMIHSGSASGGHYYAYIKDFDCDQWYCFNDQIVSKITEDDIQKTYGGGSQRIYYSGAYTSSTNAYMLMYRQIDKERNCKAMQVEDFPPHINQLLQSMRKKAAEDRLNREKENNTFRMSVYCAHPATSGLIKMLTTSDCTLAEAASYAHHRFNLEGIVKEEDCRIVSYNRSLDCINRSFDSDQLRFCDITFSRPTWMLDIRKPGTEFQTYKQDGCNVRIYPLNVEHEEIEEPITVRVDVGDTVGDLKAKIADSLNLEKGSFKLINCYFGESKCLTNDDELLQFDMSFYYRFYICNSVTSDVSDSKLFRISEKFTEVINVKLLLPDTDPERLEALSIPQLETNLEPNQSQPQLPSSATNGDRNANSPNMRVSPQPHTLCGDGFGDQSNSEDSSLSDSDRTLVGDAPGDCRPVIVSGMNSPVDLHMTSPVDPAEDTYNYDVLGNPTEEMNWENEYPCYNHKPDTNYFFKLLRIDDVDDGTSKRCCSILVDMRMRFERFKKHLEPIIKVPAEYFNILHQYSNKDDDSSALGEILASVRDGEKLTLKLGRVLSGNEVVRKIFLLKINDPKRITYLFDHIIAKDAQISKVKCEILQKMKKQYNIDIPLERCRLREKKLQKPRKVVLDDDKFSFLLYTELYVQELDGPEQVTSSESKIIMVRRWRPSTLTLDPFQEIVIEPCTVENFKKRFSNLVDIPLENLEVARCNLSFPCDMNILEIHEELNWYTDHNRSDQLTFEVNDGTIFFYRDNREKLKELTPEERKEINSKENMRLGRFSSKTYSPGRERALKIYLEPSPPQNDYFLD